MCGASHRQFELERREPVQEIERDLAAVRYSAQKRVPLLLQDFDTFGGRPEVGGAHTNELRLECREKVVRIPSKGRGVRRPRKFRRIRRPREPCSGDSEGTEEGESTTSTRSERHGVEGVGGRPGSRSGRVG